MERVRSLIRAAVGAAVLAAAPGCIGPPKAEAPKAGAPDPQTGAAAPRADGQVKQASAAVPAFRMPTLPVPTLAGGGKDKAGLPATNVIVAWRKRVEYLPDPTKNGSMGPGLVGELFLVAANNQFTTPEGPVSVELFDETPRPGSNPRQPPKLSQWRFEKDVLRQLATTDERFGKCYALFLPWPEYRPDITKVRLVVKYEPEQGFPLYAEPFTLVIDNNNHGAFQPVSGPTLGLPAGMPPPNPAAGPPTMPPGGLPPIVITR